MFIIKNCINQYKILIQDTTYPRDLPRDINFNLYIIEKRNTDM